jgi:hypothetical protein
MGAITGAETSTPGDDNMGGVSHIYTKANGSTYNGMTGYIFSTPTVYGYSTSGYTDLTFFTLNNEVC